MKKTLLIFSLIALISATGFANDEPERFSISITQDHQTISEISGKVQLKRAPFSIILEFLRPMAVLVAASDKPGRYDLALSGTPLEEFIKPATGMAEGFFNKTKDIGLSSIGTNYWYYESETDHRFNIVSTLNGKLQCERQIENLFFVEYPDKKKTKIKESNIKAIYLVAVSAEFQRETFNYKEFQRETLVIEFL